MVQANAAAITMLGLPGVVVLAAEVIDGEVETTIVTTATRAWCLQCGVRAVGAWPPRGRGAGCGCVRPARPAAVAQTHLALPRA